MPRDFSDVGEDAAASGYWVNEAERRYEAGYNAALIACIKIAEGQYGRNDDINVQAGRRISAAIRKLMK